MDRQTVGRRGKLVTDEKRNPLQVARARLSQRHLLTALNDDSNTARTGWLLFLSLMGYLIVALAGITHQDLLLNTPVHLPILNIKVALDRFFLFAPLFLVFVHGGMIIQHIVLARKLQTFNNLIKEEGLADNGIYHPLRYELHSYFFTQSFAGPPGSPLLNGFFRVMVSISLWILPVLLLVYFQTAFLPFHDPVVTAAHRFYIVLDLVLLVGIGVFVNQPETLLSRALAKRVTRRPVHFVLGVAGVLATLFFSFLVATIPDSFLDRMTRSFPPFRGTPLEVAIGKDPAGGKDRYAFWPTAFLFENIEDKTNGNKTLSFFQRNLVVTDKDLVPNREDNFGEVSANLRGRDLRYANLNRSDLHRADFTGADLSGASLVGANLKKALLSCPSLEEELGLGGDSAQKRRCTKLVGADLRKALLQHADFRAADMRFAGLESADLSMAQMEQAVLYGANFSYAKLRRTNFSLAKLQGADLSWSDAQGANFSVAELQGTNFQYAELVSGNYSNSKMEGADFSYAKLLGAVLRNTRLFRTNFTGVNLNLADLREASLYGALPTDSAALVVLADFGKVKLKPVPGDELSKLIKGIEHLPGNVREIVEERFGGAVEALAKEWPEKSDWLALIRASQREGISVEKNRLDLTNRLGNLSCGDKTPEGALVQSVVERGMYQFNGDTMLLYHRLLGQKCKPFSKVALANVEQLQKAASEYQRKLRKARKQARNAASRKRQVSKTAAKTEGGASSSPVTKTASETSAVSASAP